MGAVAETDFFCPVRQARVFWEEKDVFNPTALVRNEVVHLLYRAEDEVGEFNGTSRIGLATSTDGLHFTREPLPIFYPDNDEVFEYEWEGGCEDPRIVETSGGEYFMTYTAYDGTTARLCVASSPDLRQWTKYGPVFKAAGYVNLWSKAGAIVTEHTDEGKFIARKINGKYWMYWGESDIFLAWSTDLRTWTPLTSNEIGRPGSEITTIFGPREGKFDSDIDRKSVV